MSRTEQVLQALVAALLARSQVMGVVLPAPLRNEALPARLFQPVAGGMQFYLNVWDGDGDPSDETLGADDPGQSDGYNIAHRATVELVVSGGADADREAAFDACLIAIHDAIKPVAGLYLAGAVDMAAIDKITRSGGKALVTDGLPNMKAADITVLLTFTSSRPF